MTDAQLTVLSPEARARRLAAARAVVSQAETALAAARVAEQDALERDVVFGDVAKAEAELEAALKLNIEASA